MKAMERARERKLVDSLSGVGSVPFAVCVWGTDLKFTVPTAYNRTAAPPRWRLSPQANPRSRPRARASTQLDPVLDSRETPLESASDAGGAPNLPVPRRERESPESAHLFRVAARSSEGLFTEPTAGAQPSGTPRSGVETGRSRLMSPLLRLRRKILWAAG
jgi:hypothetical protein